MIQLMIIVFIVGYLAISLEHVLKINKAAVALFMAVVLWILYAYVAPAIVPVLYPRELADFIVQGNLSSLSLAEQSLRFVAEKQMVTRLGDISEIIFFLLGAMTIVELVDLHGGFALVSHFMGVKNKKRLLWLIGLFTFIMSATLDNMTATIIMIAIMSKLVPDRTDRLWFASVIVIAANSGGAWSPIGDVTTIMLWVKGNITAERVVLHLILPSIGSLVIPILLVSWKIKGNRPLKTDPDDLEIGEKLYPNITRLDKFLIDLVGVGGLLFVPVFKALTGLPPFMGVLLALGFLWLLTEIIYRKRTDMRENQKLRIAVALKKIDMPTIFFFFGILLAVGALQESGLLTQMAGYLDQKLHNVYLMTGIIGILSSVIDNVPLVAAAMGMYPLSDPAIVQVGTYAAHFVQDGAFWELLAYCAGVGGSLLIIGSAAGVVAMGVEKINFGWYLKHISLKVFLGYLGGMLLYVLIS